MSRPHPDGAGRCHDAPVRQAVFARELLRIGPWTTAAALKRAHQRGVLVEGRHWNWLGGVRVYYPDRLFPGLRQGGDDGQTPEALTEHLRRVRTAAASGETPT
jgi:hypothetical protein